MLTRAIPSSGEALPVLGLGTWQTFDVADTTKRHELADVLRMFVTEGGRLVDSSPMYGRAEQTLGDLAADLGLHPKLFVATKVWTSGTRAGIAQMEASMRKLRVDRIDLMQVHNLVDVETHLDTLAGWKRDGRVRYMGVTHYHAGGHDALVRLASSQPLDFIQVNYSVLEREAEDRLLPTARDRGIAVIANRPFATGDLLRRLRRRPIPEWAATIGCTTWAQLLLKFVLAHPAITCVIPATSSASHMRENLQAAGGEMPDTQMLALIAAAAA
jgi:diketogulonate reductase-like aldo/keto reductase